MHVFRLLPCLLCTLLLAACAGAPPLRDVAPVGVVRANILRLAEQEWRAFGGQIIRRAPDHHEIIDPVGIWEDERKGSALVAKYWRSVGTQWTGYDGDKPWSAAFISWVMAAAGVPADEMPATATHAGYLRAAIAEQGKWRPHPPQDYAPRPGDLICATRAGQQIERYDQVPAGATLHCDIVVRTMPGLLDSIGGNVRNSVSKSERRLGPDGRLASNEDRPWFLVLENLYP
ncbi:DUF2272 domain-containing protein [Dongia sp.]|uniref:DUF2272 domain-containing protein n=1 Tax=Dongia sp. TaxID=1977262 RepID=UPI0035B073A0